MVLTTPHTTGGTFQAAKEREAFIVTVATLCFSLPALDYKKSTVESARRMDGQKKTTKKQVKFFSC